MADEAITTEELNEIATLLHITSEIASNHPNLQSTARACQRRLNEIEADLRVKEEEEVKRSNQAAADKAAAEYKAPEPGDPNYVEPEKPLEELEPAPVADAPVDRRV